jgi:hypothetical protein
MADHINIVEPCKRERQWDHMLAVEKLKTELDIANQRILSLEGDLSAIFTRIKRGETVKLYYEGGEVIEVGGRL